MELYKLVLIYVYFYIDAFKFVSVFMHLYKYKIMNNLAIGCDGWLPGAGRTPSLLKSREPEC
jgi:hypothetical protein